VKITKDMQRFLDNYARQRVLQYVKHHNRSNKTNYLSPMRDIKWKREPLPVRTSKNHVFAVRWPITSIKKYVNAHKKQFMSPSSSESGVRNIERQDVSNVSD